MISYNLRFYIFFKEQIQYAVYAQRFHNTFLHIYNTLIWQRCSVADVPIRQQLWVIALVVHKPVKETIELS